MQNVVNESKYSLICDVLISIPEEKCINNSRNIFENFVWIETLTTTLIQNVFVFIRSFLCKRFVCTTLDICNNAMLIFHGDLTICCIVLKQRCLSPCRMSKVSHFIFILFFFFFASRHWTLVFVYILFVMCDHCLIYEKRHVNDQVKNDCNKRTQN